MNLLKRRLQAFMKMALLPAMSMVLPLPPAYACTDARVVAVDGSVITARSMEFGVPLDSRLVIRPRGSKLESPAPNGAKGLSYVAKYGDAYMDGFRIDVVTDGLNEAGLGWRFVPAWFRPVREHRGGR